MDQDLFKMENELRRQNLEKDQEMKKAELMKVKKSQISNFVEAK